MKYIAHNRWRRAFSIVSIDSESHLVCQQDWQKFVSSYTYSQFYLLKPCSVTRDRRHATRDISYHLSRDKKQMCVQLHATQLTVFIQRWRLSNFCKMSLSLHLPPSLYASTAQIKKKTVMEVPPSTSIKTDTWDIYVILLNELSAFGATFKKQIVNSSPKYCNSQRGTSQNSS